MNPTQTTARHSAKRRACAARMVEEWWNLRQDEARFEEEGGRLAEEPEVRHFGDEPHATGPPRARVVSVSAR